MAKSDYMDTWSDIVKIVIDRQFLKYVGVFTRKGELLAQAGPLEVAENEVKAISTELRLRSNTLVKVNLSKISFLCLSHGTEKMIGVSNFNEALSPDEVNVLDEIVFTMSQTHFTRQSSMLAEHALQFAAVSMSGTVLIGIKENGNNSCLEELLSMETLFKTAQVRRSTTKYSSLPRNPNSVYTDV